MIMHVAAGRSNSADPIEPSAMQRAARPPWLTHPVRLRPNLASLRRFVTTLPDRSRQTRPHPKKPIHEPRPRALRRLVLSGVPAESTLEDRPRPYGGGRVQLH